MKNHTVCFTGHRFIGIENDLSKKLQAIIKQLIDEGYLYFGVGGALGFDTLAAETILTLKKNYPCIRLILVLPCITQTFGWQSEDIRRYEKLKRLADKVVYVSQKYSKGCMYKRNRHLVDHSSVCICYLKKINGGTYYTVQYAKQKNLRIINLAHTEKDQEQP